MRVARSSLSPSVLRLAAGVLLAFVLILLLFSVTSDQPWRTLGDLFTGAVSSPGRIEQWLSYSSFVMFTGASVCLAFRIGMFAIGAEGQVLVGALAAGLVALALGPSGAALPLALAAAIAGGCVWGLVPGLMKAYLGTDEIVSTLMLNYVATFLFAFVVKEFLLPPGAGFPVSSFFDPALFLPSFGQAPAIPVVLLLGILVCLGSGLLLSRTGLGFRLRVVGESQRTALANGYSVRRLICLVFVISGGIAGAAGAVIGFGDTHRLIIGMATGIGFDGVLVALLAVNRPALVPLTALAYGYLRTGGDVIQITAGVPRDVVVVLQGLLIIGLAALLRQRERRRRSPLADDPVEPVTAKSEPGPELGASAPSLVPSTQEVTDVPRRHT
ncbi:hypothetical protein AB0M54_45015 [Actinoplanes sp. NPDC051470]|uniref:ABC transporter permease n=1 Tax=unclassified Actinoplanes TaxID=2626549 RepID=UPI0034319E88